jgi:hypothetical protein
MITGLLLTIGRPAGAQDSVAAPVQVIMPTGNPRAQATRTELQERLAGVERIIASPGYSTRLKDEKLREAALVRSRLQDGDFGVGDQVAVQVVGEPTMSGSFLIAPGRLLIVPGVADIPLAGVLRSEIQDHLTREFSKYVRNPAVRAQAMIRLSMFGDIGRPGFYQIPADILASDAIMMAGGPPRGGTSKTRIQRAGSEIVSGDEFQLAIREGVTLDQLNLQAGDEFVVVGPGPPPNVFRILGGITAVVGMIYLFQRVF